MSNKTIASVLLAFMMLMMPGTEVSAQKWKSIFSDVAKSVGEKVTEKVAEKVDTFIVAGTWAYVQPDCKFVSDNFLAQAGGEMAAAKVEGHMVDVLSKLGVKDSTTTFTFNPDSTYSVQLGGRTMKGTYSLNKQEKEITLTSRLGATFTAKVTKNVLTPKKMSLMFKADKLMSFVQNISESISKRSKRDGIHSANQLLSEYKGLLLGVELKKAVVAKEETIGRKVVETAEETK